MKLIIGGSCQGKLARAKAICGADARIADGAEVALDALQNSDILDRFHLFVRRDVENGGDAEQLARAVIAENPGLIIVCDEVGLGVVPVDAFERKWREAVGRALCVIAQESERVERVFAGLSTVIKG